MYFLDLPALMAQLAASGGGPPSVEDMMGMATKMLEDPQIKATIQKLLPKLLFQGNFDA